MNCFYVEEILFFDYSYELHDDKIAQQPKILNSFLSMNSFEASKSTGGSMGLVNMLKNKTPAQQALLSEIAKPQPVETAAASKAEEVKNLNAEAQKPQKAALLKDIKHVGASQSVVARLNAPQPESRVKLMSEISKPQPIAQAASTKSQHSVLMKDIEKPNHHANIAAKEVQSAYTSAQAPERQNLLKEVQRRPSYVDKRAAEVAAQSSDRQNLLGEVQRRPSYTAGEPSGAVKRPSITEVNGNLQPMGTMGSNSLLSKLNQMNANKATVNAP
jgi:hypothetical protein